MSLDSGTDPGALASPPSGELAPASSVIRRAVTGNRLRDGRPVYFVGSSRWSEAIEEAAHVAPNAAERLLAEAQHGRPHPVVAPYLIDVTFGEGRLRPVGLRERIRAFGPTVGAGP
ncbi:MAG TPA: DUF2849 domain-containing protein [Stellaceae bacterium]|nr:DUF2849 domain-containing protein [Stellaceae bacterium]